MAAGLLFCMVFFVSLRRGHESVYLADTIALQDHHVLGPGMRLHKSHRSLQQA